MCKMCHMNNVKLEVKNVQLEVKNVQQVEVTNK